MDEINGGNGTDTLTLNMVGDVVAADLTGVTLTSIENVNIRATGKVGVVGLNDVLNDGDGTNNDGTATAAVDFSTLALSDLNVTQAASASLKAATTTNVNVSGVTGGIEVNGGNNVVISDASNNNNITVGSVVAAGADNANSAGTAAAGTITVTDSKQGSGVIQIDGGTDVTVTASTDKVSSGAIVVGATKGATGAVTITQNLTSDGTAVTAGDVTVTGGSSVTINANLTNTAVAGGSANAITAGTYTVTGGNATTAVTINQNVVATDVAASTTGATNETAVVTFGSLKAGEKVAISSGALNGLGTDLTFTAGKDLTAAEVAAAFANLTSADRQSSGGPVANGVFTGQLDAGWTSGAVSGSTVTFTATTTGNKDDITVTAKKANDTTNVDNVASFSIVKTDGGAGTTVSGVDVTADYGAVVVNDNATKSITSITLNGYDGATLGAGGSGSLNSLTTLSLTKGTGTTALTSTAATLALSVNGVAGTVDVDGASATTLKTLNVTASGANSTFILDAEGVETLTVTGDKVLDISSGSTDLAALKTVTVTGSAGLKINASGATVTSVNSSGTTGAVTATIDASKATYTGGEGVDTVTLAASTVSKNISLGGGNDVLDASAATLTGSFTFDGGTGTNTLKLGAAQADSLDNDALFEGKISNFSKLSLGQVADDANITVNLANIDDISYVISAGTHDTAEVKTLTLTVGTAIAAGDTVSITINGTTYTTAALSASATNANIATAIVTAVGAGYTVTASGGVLTFTSATGGTTVLSGLTVTGTGTVTGVEAETSSQLTLTNMADNGTLELTGAGVGATVTMADATGASDTFNIVTKVDGSNLNFGVVTVAGVETINLTATDTTPVNTTTGDATISQATLALFNSAAKTVNVNGESDLVLDLSNALAVTKVDAGTFTGKLTLTATGSSAMTVIGGSAADTLTASGSGDVLQGGAGADILTGANLTTLTGGAGNDIFMMNTPTNVNSYSSITDLSAGDVIDLDAANAGTVVFVKAAITLAATAVFQDYANAAANALGTDGNDAAWFQFQGNTYIVKSGNTTANNDFVNGQDSIIQIVGLVDLSTASYNQSIGTLEIA